MTQNNSLVKEFSANPLLWGMSYFKKHFRGDSPAVHLKIVKEAMSNRYLAVAAPRGSAKSTILAFLIPFHCISYKKKHHIVIVSNTYKKACVSLENIKDEIRTNALFKADFNIIIRKDAEGDSIFRHPDGFEVRVLCKGAEQIGSIRGELFNAFRPDLFIIDDVEDDEMVRNPERRSELHHLIDEALIPAGDVHTMSILVIGTILHDDSQMSKFISPFHYREFRKLKYRALIKNKDGSFKSLWAYKWSVDDLLELQKEKPDVFAKEMQNDPVSGANTKFTADDFRYWTIDNMQYVLFNKEGGITAKGELRDCQAAMACDLAWEEGKENDFSVVLPAFLTPQSDILIDTYLCKKGLRPDEMEEVIFTMEERLRSITGSPVPIGFEKAKLEKVAKWFLKQAMKKRNRSLWLKDLQWDTDKIQRILTKLQPRYSQHMLYHKRGMGDLENQITRFPSAAHDDLPDALQGVCQLLEYPKNKRVTSNDPESEFKWWQKQTQLVKKPPKTRYVFGHKQFRKVIPATVSFR